MNVLQKILRLLNIVKKPNFKIHNPRNSDYVPEGFIKPEGQVLKRSDYQGLFNALDKDSINQNNTFSFSKEKVPEDSVTQAELIVNKIKTGEAVSMTDINIVLSDLLDIHAINGTVHRLNKYILDEAVFIIDTVNVVADKDDKLEKITLTLKETIFNLDMEIRINSKTFHETFSQVDLPETSPR